MLFQGKYMHSSRSNIVTRRFKFYKFFNKNLKIKSSKKIIGTFVLGCLINSHVYSALNDPSDIDLTRTLAAVGTGPYFGLGATYDGSELVVMQPNIHRDFALLQQNMYMMKKTGEVNGPNSPYVQLSGMAEVQLAVQSKSKNYVDITSSNLDIAAWINKWLTAYANFGVEFDEAQRSYFRMLMAFITLGDLSTSPFYASVGQMYIPFGSFSTGTSDLGTLPRAIGRIYDKAISVGYYPGNGLHLTGAVYNGYTKNSKTSNLDQIASTLSYKRKVKLFDTASSYKVGVSYTNNIQESVGIRGVFSHGAILNHFVPGGDIFASFSFGDYTLRTEYISALKHFSSKDILQGGKKVKPSSYLAEADYNRYILGKKATVTLHYSEVQDAAMATLLQHQMGVNTSINILKNTLLSVELSHRKSYDHNNFISNARSTYSPLNLSSCKSINSRLNNKARNVLVTTLDAYY
jgi:hypothetical protein